MTKGAPSGGKKPAKPASSGKSGTSNGGTGNGNGGAGNGNGNGNAGNSGSESGGGSNLISEVGGAVGQAAGGIVGQVAGAALGLAAQGLNAWANVRVADAQSKVQIAERQAQKDEAISRAKQETKLKIAEEDRVARQTEAVERTKQTASTNDAMKYSADVAAATARDRMEHDERVNIMNIESNKQIEEAHDRTAICVADMAANAKKQSAQIEASALVNAASIKAQGGNERQKIANEGACQVAVIQKETKLAEIESHERSQKAMIQHQDDMDARRLAYEEKWRQAQQDYLMKKDEYEKKQADQHYQLELRKQTHVEDAENRKNAIEKSRIELEERKQLRQEQYNAQLLELERQKLENNNKVQEIKNFGKMMAEETRGKFQEKIEKMKLDREDVREEKKADREDAREERRAQREMERLILESQLKEKLIRLQDELKNKRK